MNRQQMIEVALDALDNYVGQFDGNEQGMAEDIVDALIARRGDESAEFHVRRDAPDTSKAVADKIKSGSLGEHILYLYGRLESFGGGGYTDEELEFILKRKHQSVSAARNLLVRKGYLVDSGERRRTSSNNPAIVWRRTEKPVTR